MGYERFSSLIEDFLVFSPFLLDPDPNCFCLDLDPYQSSPWIRIRNKFFHILDPDPYQNDTDPPHWWGGRLGCPTGLSCYYCLVRWCL